MTFRTLTGSLAIIGLFLSSSINAGPHECDGTLSKRPLSDFLDAQGTLNDPPAFFTSVPDYSGWASPIPDFVDCDDIPQDVNFALVDYAGLANNFLGNKLRTKVRGSVFECSLDDGLGNSEITVKLFTRRALSFAQSVRALCDNGFDFASTPTIFGNKAEDVAHGAKPALGWATFQVRFLWETGAPLPDFLELDPTDGGQVHKLNFRSVAFGRCADRTPCFLHVVQKAEDGNFTEEVVDIIKLGSDDD